MQELSRQYRMTTENIELHLSASRQGAKKSLSYQSVRSSV